MRVSGSATIRRLLVSSLAVLATAGVACGSSGDHGGNSKRPATVDPAKSVAAVTVSAMDGTAQGSGVLIDRPQGGLVVMSDHLIEGAHGRSIKVVFANGETAQGRPVARNMCSDIALVAVRPEPHDVPALPLADVTGLGPGARVRVLGYHATPGGEGTPAPLATQGTVSSVGVSERLFPRLHVVPGLILHQSPMPEGATGGALVDGRGRLVGVNVDIHPGGEGADRPHLAKAVAASYLKSTIAELEPGRAGLYRNWEKYHACHGEMMMLAQQTRAGKTTSAAHGMPSGHAHKTRDHGGMSGH